jgi:hypothetical protein
MPESFGRRSGHFSFKFNIEDVFPARPALAVPFAMAISYWSYVESWYANLQTTLRLDQTLDELLRFQKMRNSKRHLEEVRSSAGRVLPAESLCLFERALETAIEPGVERNDLVHGIAMLIEEGFPDAIIILRPEHLQKLHYNTFGAVLRVKAGLTYPGVGNPVELGVECMSHAAIYRLADLEQLVRQIKTSERLMFHLWQLTAQSEPAAVEIGQRSLRELLSI